MKTFQENKSRYNMNNMKSINFKTNLDEVDNKQTTKTILKNLMLDVKNNRQENSS